MKDFKPSRSYRTLLETDSNGEEPSSYYVYVSHMELDNLVGRLMQMCDLIGDKEQRTALKDTIKRINRDWLDDLYDESGYERFSGVIKGVNPVIIDRYQSVEY
jgi:hypothetical protein